ncbi:hypothetical protein KY284_030941 [Solanum tuberosum]|nr:hypothetical protein KY284_030941 [Solanum tuberosum]
MMIIDEVEIVFNYGCSWVILPLLVYTKKLVHSWLNFDLELLSHKNICDEFTSKLGISRVKQLLVTRPSRKYYIVDGDDGIWAILSLLYVEVGTDCEHNVGSDYEWDLSEGGECDYEWTEAISKERGRVVSDRLENFKELQVGMTFKDMKEGDTKRTRYGCDVGCPFRCLISRDGKTEGFKIKSFINKHTCEEAFFNARADAVTLAQYFKTSFKIISSIRAKRMALEKLEGSFIDDYNKLEAYAQELKQSNPKSDVLINISRNALAKGKRKFLRMCKGMMLVALGQDFMNSFYPLAWSIVDKETSRTWCWFIELLKGSLDLKDGAKITFISDMQKGLIDVVDRVLPEAQHRFCVRHIESN